MAYIARPSEFIPCGESLPDHHGDVGDGVARRPGLLRRIFNAVYQSRQTQAEREVVAYLESTGGRFTDSIERRLIERLTSGSWPR
jgi:hypothetical protein